MCSSDLEKIVSLAPNTTEILYFLGAEERIVGRTTYCTYPLSMAEIPAVGDTFNPNIEAIIELEPDLVVASTHISEEVINKLREVGVTVAFLNEQESFEGTYSAIANIGKLIGEETLAQQVIAEMQGKIDDTVTKIAALPKTEDMPKVYYTMGFGEGDFTAGGDTFIGEMITLEIGRAHV